MLSLCFLSLRFPILRRGLSGYRGILHCGFVQDAAPQPSAIDLEAALDEDSRASLPSLQKPCVIPAGDTMRAATSKQLGHELKVDLLRCQLANSRDTTPSHLEERGLLKFPFLSPNLADTANQLEQRQKSDKLSKQMVARKDVDELHRSNIRTKRVATN